MLRFYQFLKEFRFADLHPKQGEWKQIPVGVLKKAQNEPAPNIDTELYDLLRTSYASIGGHIDFKKPSDLPANHTIWHAIDTDGDKKPEALSFAKQTPYGVKMTGAATDGSDAGKRAYIDSRVSLLKKPGTFGEFSEAIMHILITRHQVPCVSDQADVEKIIGKQVKWLGAHPEGKYAGYNGFYIRELGGHAHMKILLGTPRI